MKAHATDTRHKAPAVLLIDDDAVALEELSEIIELEGWEPVLASCSDEAISCIENLPQIRVVVTDLHLNRPDGASENGVDVIETAKSQFPDRDLSFIVLSGDAGAAARSMTSGVADVLTKPLIAQSLIDAVDEALASVPNSANADGADAFLMRRFTQKVEALQRVTADLAERDCAVADAKDKLRQLQDTDPETGLCNAAKLAREIDSRPQATGLLLRVDLNGFAGIRDAFGTTIATRVLLDYAALLGEIVGPTGVIARLGRQQLGAFVPDFADPDDQAALAARVSRRLADAPVAEDLGINIVPTVGLATEEEGVTNGENLIANSELALENALGSALGAVSFYEHRLRQEAEKKRVMGGRLRSALENGHIVPWYQPQICLRTGHIVGFEALARWQDPGEGPQLPSEFLSLAADAGLMKDLDYCIQSKALDCLSTLRHQGVVGCRIGLNLTACQLRDQGLVETLLFEMDRVGIAPEHVAVEVLESAALDRENGAAIQQNLERLSELGFAIELDDFGTGHAGLTSLRDLPVDRIKIDRSFVAGVHLDTKLQKFTRALIHLAKALEIEVLAEGVECQEELEWLRNEGCDLVQGYLLARPMPGDQIAIWAADRVVA